MNGINISIGSYNIANGGYADHDFSRIAEDILACGLDIVGLQEVDIGTFRVKKADTMKELSEKTCILISHKKTPNNLKKS